MPHVPWTRPHAKRAHIFEDTCAWLAAHAVMSVLTGAAAHRPDGRNTNDLLAGATLLTHVSCDGAEWIHALVRQRAPQAVICLDPFYADLRIMPMSAGLRLVTTVSIPVRSA